MRKQRIEIWKVDKQLESGCCSHRPTSPLFPGADPLKAPDWGIPGATQLDAATSLRITVEFSQMASASVRLVDGTYLGMLFIFSPKGSVRIDGHARSETLVGDPAEQLHLGRHQLFVLELVAVLAAAELEHPAAFARVSMTPSALMNSVTISFPISLSPCLVCYSQHRPVM
jgi:hypothetical protein